MLWRRELIYFEILDIVFPKLDAYELAACVTQGRGILDGYQINPKFSEEVDRGLDSLHSIPDHELNALYLRKCAEDGRVPSFSFSALAEGHFFDQPEAMADFGFWANIDYWTPDETVSLSFGRSPDVVNKKRLSRFIAEQPRFATEFFYRNEQIMRAVSTGTLPEKISPKEFIDWAQSKEMDVPEELLVQHKTPSTRQRDEIKTSQKQLKERERDSLLKLILGMSVDSYNYKVGEPKNDATGENPHSIAARLESLGLTLTSDTIRKYLKEAEQRFGDLVKNPDKY